MVIDTDDKEESTKFMLTIGKVLSEMNLFLLIFFREKKSQRVFNDMSDYNGWLQVKFRWKTPSRFRNE